MSQAYLYLSTLPEALVASMLPPDEFGTYLAVGTKKRSHGIAMFFQLDESSAETEFDLARMRTECVSRPDGTPKRTSYLAIYRVLERVPLDAFKNLYLVTKDGRVLELHQRKIPVDFSGTYHVYDEIAPVHPLVGSRLSPPDFVHFITDPDQPIHVPRLCFAEIDVPEINSSEVCQGRVLRGTASDYVEHIRDCLCELESGSKETKVIDRTHQVGTWARRFKNGFFVGDQQGLIYYPFPSEDELNEQYHDWWRSALES